MDLTLINAKFNSILSSLNSHPTVNFCTAVESGYEALTLAHVIQEYARILGGVHTMIHPASQRFLNQKNAPFTIERSFKVSFNDGSTFYFATDVEVHGLPALESRSPIGDIFEADIVVIPEKSALDIVQNYYGFPAPQHLHSVYECKFGQYKKSHLRELLGLRRHVSFVRGPIRNGQFSLDPNSLFYRAVINSRPAIAVKMVRPKYLNFFSPDAQHFFDLHQIVVK